MPEPPSTAKPDDETAAISVPRIPESAANGLEFCLWCLEREGITFRNGKTAAYWNLIAVLTRHIEVK